MTIYSSIQYLLAPQADADGSYTSTYEALLASGDQLLVVETGLTQASGVALLSSEQIATLEDDGRTLLGYVNATVTDSNRSYWYSSWIVPGTWSGDNEDTGTATDSAPGWLSAPLGTATGPEDVVYGPIVDFRDPEWRAIVIAQAVEIVEAGYDGVYLDDVARYYMGDIPLTQELAQEIMALVNDVADAVHAINPEAEIVVNGGGYLHWNSDPVGGNDFNWWEYLSNVDGFVIEYVSEDSDPANWSEITEGYYDLVNFFYLVDDGLVDEIDSAELAGLGVTVDVVPDPEYDDLPPAGDLTAPEEPSEPTVEIIWVDGVQVTLFYGTDGDDLIDLSGLGMAAIIYGLDGDDTIIGTGYDDLIFAGSGDDLVQAGAGNDSILGAAGCDSLQGGGGDDVLSGGSGDDLLSGGNGDDLMFGGDLPDDFAF